MSHHSRVRHSTGNSWTRSNNPEIDIVAADRQGVARRITAVGSITWLENRPFDAHDLARLLVHRSQLPGGEETTPLVAVSRAGSTLPDLRVVGPDELLDAWR